MAKTLEPVSTSDTQQLLSAINSSNSVGGGARAAFNLIGNTIKARKQIGLSEADVFEAMAAGCSKLDVCYYLFSVLEYLCRYTTAYGATVIVVLGLFKVFELMKAGISELWNFVFSDEAPRAERDRVMRDELKSAGSMVEMAEALQIGVKGLLPPGMGLLVEKLHAKTSSGSSSAEFAKCKEQLAACIKENTELKAAILEYKRMREERNVASTTQTNPFMPSYTQAPVQPTAPSTSTPWWSPLATKVGGELIDYAFSDSARDSARDSATEPGQMGLSAR